MWESERASEDMADARKRIAELEAERNALLEENSGLREELRAVPEVAIAAIGTYFKRTNRHFVSGLRESVELQLTDWKNAALTAPATTEALERVRKQAQAEVLDWLVTEADRQRSGIVRAFGQVDPGDILGIAVKKAAELRGGK